MKRLTLNGQATTEITLLLPLFVMLAGGAMAIGYMCYQGLKVQQAANLAARIHGQERVMGGATSGSIMLDNGTGMGYGDRIPTDGGPLVNSDGTSRARIGAPPPLRSVYGRFYKAAKDFFGSRDKVFVPPPVHQGVNTDQVKVVRVLKPPKILSLELKPISLEATAYGGEDPRMYGLPRWGTVGNGSPFYQSQIRE